MNPHIIIDAWHFNGYSSECNSEEQHGLIGNYLRVKEKGSLWVNTSWGKEEFGPGDLIIILDVAAAIADGEDPINEVNLSFIHELCHWAEGVHRPGRKHTPIWREFLTSLLIASGDKINE